MGIKGVLGLVLLLTLPRMSPALTLLLTWEMPGAAKDPQSLTYVHVPFDGTTPDPTTVTLTPWATDAQCAATFAAPATACRQDNRYLPGATVCASLPIPGPGIYSVFLTDYPTEAVQVAVDAQGGCTPALDRLQAALPPAALPPVAPADIPAEAEAAPLPQEADASPRPEVPPLPQHAGELVLEEALPGVPLEEPVPPPGSMLAQGMGGRRDQEDTLPLSTLSPALAELLEQYAAAQQAIVERYTAVLEDVLRTPTADTLAAAQQAYALGTAQLDALAARVRAATLLEAYQTLRHAYDGMVGTREEAP